MIIAIDFDGTIVEDKFPEIGEMMPGAAEVINELYHSGHKIIIWTSRQGINLLRAIEWMAKNGIRYHHINESCPQNVAAYGNDTRKIFADIYIDDKSLIPPPGDWQQIREMIRDKIV
jgi:predicted mannosyl-3-phosphoglycerate phosphatase (HAD superfamily)